MNHPKKINGEPDSSFDALTFYLKQGKNRTITKTAELLNVPKSRLYYLSSKWKWEQRIKACTNDSKKQSILKKENAKQTNVSDNTETLAKGETVLFLEIAKSLQKLLSILNKKIECEEDEIESLKIDELVKLISNFNKALLDIRRFFGMAPENTINEEKINKSLPFLSKLREDDTIMQLSSQLLQRISDIEDEEAGSM